MDIVLGVSMAPPSVRMVLVEGENAGGVTVDEDDFEVDEGIVSFPERVVSAILGTQEGAQQGGYRLASTGVTVADQLQAGELRDALADRRVENVMLVSAFLAAAALAQSVGGAIGYARTALMFIEPDNATLAVVDSSDGSITEVHRVALPSDDVAAVGELTALAARSGLLSARPEGLFVVGSGVNVGVVKPELDVASPIPVTVPEEPDTALARGAALASAHSPLFDSSTSALAWARDPGTGAIDPELVALGYAYLAGGATGYDEHALAYSAVADDIDSGYLGYVEAGTSTVEVSAPSSGVRLFGDGAPKRPRKPFLLAGSALGSFFVVAVASLAVVLAVSIRPTADERPDTGRHIVPAQQAPAAPPPAAPVAQPPAPEAPAPEAPAPVPAAPAPAAPAPPPAAAPAPAPKAPAPAPVAPAPKAPAPAPKAPAPAPAPAAPPPAPAPVAPIPIPIPIQIPAPAPEPPKAKQPDWPRIFEPPKQSPPKNDNPSWLPGNNGGGHKDDGPSWFPDNDGGGKKGGAPSPWLPGNGGGNKGGNSPWLPDWGGGNKGGGGSWFPDLGGGGKGGGSWFPDLGGGKKGGGWHF